MSKYNVIGVMSGTSLDGLDIAHCKFSIKKDEWSYSIKSSETLPYSEKWKERLQKATDLPGIDLISLHFEYGHYIGSCVKEFIKNNKIYPNFISSHGHTVFHQPDKKVTFQIGAGSSIATEVGLPVVCDFRTLDVALGGQGAPLVPVGDKLLFPEYSHCLNLGGFANISFEKSGKQIAFDLCPVNIVLNHLAGLAGMEYDKDGNLGKKGKVNKGLLSRLNDIPFYSQPFPKSLGKEWVQNVFNPVLENGNILLPDKMRTLYEHFAIQIEKGTGSSPKGRILVTGGGAFNKFLLERIRENCSIPLALPDKKTIEFKEALIFAFLGVLRYREEINTLKTVTGARANSSGGCIYYAK